MGGRNGNRCINRNYFDAQCFDLCLERYKVEIFTKLDKQLRGKSSGIRIKNFSNLLETFVEENIV